LTVAGRRAAPASAEALDGGGPGTTRPVTRFALHCSHEQIPPSRLLRAARLAQEAGFDAGMSSDHFAPWSERQGESGFAWAFLGAALASTSLPFGVVNAPGQRYHPAIVAQAAATIAEMFPGRLWVALGSGEAANEHITGEPWPPKEERNARLRECVDVMRALFAGEEVSHRGRVVVDRARLYTRPQEPPPLLAAAVSEATARWAGSWADGLATVNGPVEHLRRMLDAFGSGGGTGKLVLQVHLSWAPTDEEALRIAHDQWRTNVFDPPLCWDLDTPEAFDAAARYVRPEDVRAKVLVSSDTERHVAWLSELAGLGFDEIALHHVGRDLDAFIDAFGERVLPRLR
jgi:probable non-F420 flavinoid oxidoreductase